MWTVGLGNAAGVPRTAIAEHFLTVAQQYENRLLGDPVMLNLYGKGSHGIRWQKFTPSNHPLHDAAGTGRLPCSELSNRQTPAGCGYLNIKGRLRVGDTNLQSVEFGVRFLLLHRVGCHLCYGEA
jgi:hypothetical protein